MLRSVRASTGCAPAGLAPLGSYLPSTRRHRLPGGQNVLRRVLVAVMVFAALWASPLPNLQWEFFKDVPAVETPLARRVEAVASPQFPSVPLALVPEHRQELAEGCIGERASKTVVLGHAAHVQVLDGDHVEATDKIGSGFMQVVSSSISDPGVEPGDLEPLDCPPFRALRFAREVALGANELTFQPIQMPGIGNLFSSREGRQRHKSEIDSDRLVDGRKVLRRLVKAERDEIAIRRILGHRYGRRHGDKFPRPANLETTDAGKREIAVLHVPLEGGSGVLGGLVMVLALESRVSGALLEEVDERRLEMPERLLRRDAGDIIEPIMVGRSLERGQHGARFVVADGNAFLVVGVGSDPQRPVVDVPARAEDMGEFALLSVGGVEAESVSNFHTHSISYVRLESQEGGAFPPPPEGGGFRASIG